MNDTPTSWPGYTRLLGTPDMIRLADQPVTTVEQYRVWHALHVTQRGASVWDPPTPRVAFVNGGVWKVECAYCHQPVATHPDMPVAYCGECGARYNEGLVEFPAPELLAQITTLLCARPMRETQHWTTETTDELMVENAENMADGEPSPPQPEGG